MFDRVSTVDGKSYAIGFEMRLPDAWNGRFFYQANGGTDGSVVTASGGFGGGPATSPLAQGFAVISSDAGHNAAQNPTFGIDPQARLDYGYQAVAKLTPMAKAVIQTAYGKGPDRSYFGGCSNGGRHTLVAASRYADQYDGFLVGDPGLRLPLRRDRQHRQRPDLRRAWRRRRATPSTGFTHGRAPAGLERRARASATRSTAPPTAWCRTPRPARPRSTWTATCRPAPARATAPA